jgi:NADH-quinone oxidoreductase subunit M
MDNLHLLSLILFLPLLFGVVILFLKQDDAGAHRNVAMLGTIVTMLVSFGLLVGFHGSGAAGLGAIGTSASMFQFEEVANWLPTLSDGNAGASYHIGIDGIGLLMVLMTTIVFPFVVGLSIPAIKERTKMFYFLVMLVETAILGTFVSLDLILFYVFYEAMLIPLYFLIGIWGGEKRIFATMKFFLYTMVGSMLMLVSILSIYFMVGTFDLVALQSILPGELSKLGANGGLVEMLLFLGFFAAFAVKAPLWPFHTWVPDAYAEAPAGVSIILVALKMGLYGFIRFCLPLFPHAVQTAAPVIVTLAVIGVIYAALSAAVQKDLKRLIAYSSISHVGVIMLAIFGLTAAGISGAVIQMFSHTFTTGALFILAYYLYARRGTYDIAAYGGVWKVMPYFAALFLITTLSAIALPGTSGFTGEFLMLLGSFQTHPWAAGFATTAAIWSAVYMLWMFQRVMHGPIDQPEVESMTDISKMQKLAFAPIIAIIVILGIYPQPALQAINPSVTSILTLTNPTLVDQSPIPTTPPGSPVQVHAALPNGRASVIALNSSRTAGSRSTTQ